MPTFMQKMRAYIVAHKIVTGFIVILIVLIGIWGYKKATSTSGDTRYLTVKVAKGTIIASVSGTGQVSDSNQIDLKPKTSGNIVYVGVKNGDKVGSGALIAQIDTKDADRAIRDAQTSLDSANLALEKLKIQNSNENLNADLAKAYDDGFNEVSAVFLDIPSVISNLEPLMNNSNLSDNAARASGTTAQSYKKLAEDSYYAANTAYTKDRTDFRGLTHDSKTEDIANIISETYDMVKLTSDAVKNTKNYVDFMAEDSASPSAFASYQSTLATYTNTVNGHLNTLNSIKTTIKSNQDAVPNASLDVQSAELTIQEKENALQDAKDARADYFIRAPYAGTIANLTLKKSDSVSTGSTVATLITNQQFAQISMNEVDVAKIKTGEKATLTFDAIPDLTMSGEVSEIDSLGTESQGVVTYNVKITFDTADPRIKPGMSVSANIITDVRQDVLLVPNSAIKSQNGTSYVEAFDAPLPAPTDGLVGSISKMPPNKIPVETGLSNDSDTEITSGLTEGEEIVSRTIAPASATKAAAAPSLFGAPGGGTRISGAGANIRPRGN